MTYNVLSGTLSLYTTTTTWDHGAGTINMTVVF